jgi:hypothetical protein
MPLTGTESGLSALIKSKRLAANPAAKVADNAALQADCDAIAEAVIEHFLSNGMAAVLAGLLVAPPGGGPVTGTGNLT